jgi:hypothetical protein
MKVAQIGVANFGARRRHIMRQSGLFELIAAYDLNREALAQCQAEDGARPVSPAPTTVSRRMPSLPMFVTTRNACARFTGKEQSDDET